MHYLLIGKEGNVEKLGKFMDLTTAGVPMESAFQQAFEVSFEAMEKELRNYVKQDRYNFIQGHFEKKLELDVSAEATELTEAEVQAYLGDLLWHSRRVDCVKYLEKALKLDPNQPMAHASLGMVRFYEGKVDEARASLERAVAANSQNYLAHYYYAFALSRQRPEDTTANYTPEQTAKIREHLQRAIALRPDYPESYDLLAFVSLVNGTDKEVDEAIVSMKRVLSASPGRSDFQFMLVQLYMHKNDYKSARPLLEELAKSTEEEISQPSKQLLSELDSYDKKLAAIEEARKVAAAPGNSRIKMINSSDSEPETDTPAPAKPSAPAAQPDPSSYLREILRTPETGETQLQTTLVRIECDAKGMVFVVRTATGELRLHTRSFDDMELTTYSPDVKGEITCGPRKPENIVIVCYLPNTDKRVKADGILKSIEFVPADFKLKATP
jgi:Tfp pilus assembly protein PilF